MNQEEFPVWLKTMQNGTIGEARTRAFLIDRFWVLERSVDIDGADFIIQRRITSSNLLDEKPPRLEIVQAKFFSGLRLHIIYMSNTLGIRAERLEKSSSSYATQVLRRIQKAIC